MKLKEQNSLEQNKQIQNKRLFEIISYAKTNIPYYQKILKNISFSEKTIEKDILKIPILTKEIIRQEKLNLVNKKLLKKARKNSSGGSTGEPVTLFQDKLFLDYTAASKILFEEWSGRDQSDLLVKLWGSEEDTLKGTQGIRGLFVRHIMKMKILNTFHMNNKKIRKYIEFINKYKPKVIGGYVQSLLVVSKELKINPLTYKPKGIMSSAGTLYPEFRKEIEKSFKTKVFNIYGSREVGDMASECEKHEGLHLNMFMHYFEILDSKKNKVTNENEKGEVHITTLNNLVMPLIRYEIGDIATNTNKICSCNRGMPLIKSVNGRTVNIFRNEKNDLIDGEFFTHLFYFKKWIKQFQVVQISREKLDINVVLKERENKKEKKEINKSIKKVMGENCVINWNYLQNIKPTKSGKFLYTVSKIK